MRAAISGLAWLCLASPAAAAVVDSQPGGFEVREQAQVAATPAQVYAAIGRIGQWWNSQHTYSRDARNLSLELKAGGCFCEQLKDGGSVRHMGVILALPNKLLRLEGALGPLATTAGTGRLSFTLEAKGAGTEVVLTYDFGGYANGGLSQFAAPVDEVLGGQLDRLKLYVETGRPDAH